MATSPAQLSGLFKEAYASDIQNLVPEVAKVLKMVPFVSRDKETGNLYHQPVVLSQEHGITYASPSDGAFVLEAAVAMNMGDAQLQGSQMLLRTALSYDAAAKASNSKKAFVKATDLIVDNMLESMSKRVEIALLYGGSGLADIAVGGFDETAPSATTATFVVTEASFAAGIWSGLENAKIEFYNGSSNANSDSDKNIKITAIDIDTRTITVEGSANAIEDINDISASNALKVFFKGAYGKEMAGLDKIITNAGLLFNINAANYALWKGNSVSTTGSLTMGKVLKAVSKAVARGLNEDVVVLVNPDTWADLASDLAAIRMYDSSYSSKKAENGSESICYYGQNGKIDIVSHNCIKASEALIFPVKRVKRIGAQEISFETPGRSDEIFLHLPDSAGFELRVYCDQAIFVETPARCVKISGFTNAA